MTPSVRTLKGARINGYKGSIKLCPRGANNCGFSKYYTCSNCEEFEENPKKWDFEQVQDPKAGDIAIQHKPTGRAYHAVIITKIENGKYYVSHADSTKYIKNVELKNKA